MLRLAVAAASFLIAASIALGAAQAEPVHGIALYGGPKQPANFTHFSYVNADAPKGGRLTMSSFGSFDSLNPLIVRGVPANPLRGAGDPARPLLLGLLPVLPHHLINPDTFESTSGEAPIGSGPSRVGNG